MSFKYKLVMSAEFNFPHTGITHVLKLERDDPESENATYSLHYSRTGSNTDTAGSYLVRGVDHQAAGGKFHEYADSIQFGEI